MQLIVCEIIFATMCATMVPHLLGHILALEWVGPIISPPRRIRKIPASLNHQMGCATIVFRPEVTKD